MNFRIVKALNELSSVYFKTGNAQAGNTYRKVDLYFNIYVVEQLSSVVYIYISLFTPRENAL